MNKSISIVIDADIARASGTTTHPVSSASRALLDNLMAHGHDAVFCQELLAEWKKHRSTYSARWLSSMFAKRKINIVQLRNMIPPLIEQHIEDEHKSSIAKKDAHLVDAAIVADKIIASNDENAKHVFSELAANCGLLKNIGWLNAVKDKNFIFSLLSSRCQVPKKYLLHPSDQG